MRKWLSHEAAKVARWIAARRARRSEKHLWKTTWRLDSRADRNWMVRPERRYDWFSPRGPCHPASGRGLVQEGGTSGNQFGQFSDGCNLLFRFSYGSHVILACPGPVSR